jgi:hypothetical protein
MEHKVEDRVIVNPDLFVHLNRDRQRNGRRQLGPILIKAGDSRPVRKQRGADCRERERDLICISCLFGEHSCHSQVCFCVCKEMDAAAAS